MKSLIISKELIILIKIVTFSRKALDIALKLLIVTFQLIYLARKDTKLILFLSKVINKAKSRY